MSANCSPSSRTTRRTRAFPASWSSPRSSRGCACVSRPTSEAPMATVTVEVEARGAVALVTLKRPQNGNALNLQMAMDLLAAAMTCARNSAVRAVLLTGAGPHFCFGGDLRGMSAHEGATPDYVRELTTYLHAALSKFARMDAPVIAAVTGTAAGARWGPVAVSDLPLYPPSSPLSLASPPVLLPPPSPSP